MDCNANRQSEVSVIRIVALISGGIDSAVMCLMLKRHGADIRPLFIDYGQLAGPLEWQAVQMICKHLDISPPVKMDVSGFGKLIPSGITDSKLDVKKKAFLPTRNLLFLSLGAAYAYSNDIYFVAIGLLSESIFPDQTEEFVSHTQKTISQALGVNLRVLTPLIKFNKLDTIRLAKKYSLPLKITYSCHLGGKQPCGRCISCQERIAALEYITERDSNSG